MGQGIAFKPEGADEVQVSVTDSAGKVFGSTGGRVNPIPVFAGVTLLLVSVPGATSLWVAVSHGGTASWGVTAGCATVASLAVRMLHRSGKGCSGSEARV